MKGVKIFTLWDRIGLAIVLIPILPYELAGKYFRKLSFPDHLYSPQ